MLAARLMDFSVLAAGRYGIRALPAPDSFADPAQLELILVPGLAFTVAGGRLGLGGGYYDRFLPLAGTAVRAGVTLSPQIAPELPLAGHDARMDFLITEAGITACLKNR